MTRISAAATVVFAVSLACSLLGTLRSDHFDDAFITYVFARNLADGQGLTWVAGDPPLYSVTSLTYPLLLAGARRLGFDLQAASAVLGASSWALAHAFLFLAFRRRDLVVALFGALLSAVSLLPLHCSMGMESGLFTAAVLAALWIQHEQWPRSASIAAAVAAATRPEGVLVLALLAGHAALRSPAASVRQRLLHAFRQVAPGLVLFGFVTATAAAYFGTPVPQSLMAKLHFGCDVSGIFSPIGMAFLLVQHLGRMPVLVVLGGATIGGVRWLLGSDQRDPLVLPWALLHGFALTAGRAPDSPWYYAPLIPVTFMAFAIGFVSEDPDPNWRKNATRLTLMAAVAFNLYGTVQTVRADPLGALAAWNGEKRSLARAVLADMERRSVPAARVLAFEVGYFGYVVPGRVIDLLGIVSPGFQPCLRGEDPDRVLERLRPDYVVIVDRDEYRATACVHRAPVLQRDFAAIVVLPRFGHNYVVYARR